MPLVAMLPGITTQTRSGVNASREPVGAVRLPTWWLRGDIDEAERCGGCCRCAWNFRCYQGALRPSMAKEAVTPLHRELPDLVVLE